MEGELVIVAVITEEISRPDRGHYDVNTTISIKVSQSVSQSKPPLLSSLYLP